MIVVQAEFMGVSGAAAPPGNKNKNKARAADGS